MSFGIASFGMEFHSWAESAGLNHAGLGHQLCRQQREEGHNPLTRVICRYEDVSWFTVATKQKYRFLIDVPLAGPRLVTNSIRIQHYVPRFYLRNFSTKQGDAFLINCFDKTSQKIFRVNIENVAAESSFYDTDKYTNQLVEKSLGRHESEFNEAHRKMLKVKNYRALKKKERTSLLFFMSSQEIRTREMRESLKDMVQQIHKRLSRERLSDDLREQIEEARTDAAIKDLHVRVLVEDVPKFVAIMAQMKWVLMQNRTSMPFWTSDHPVNRFNPVVHKPYGSLGLVKTGINTYFPLSPSLVLCLCDPIFYRMLPDKVDVTDEEEVIFQNHLQVNYSTRHLFSPTNDFALAKKMISENADLGDVTRKRHEVT